MRSIIALRPWGHDVRPFRLNFLAVFIFSGCGLALNCATTRGAGAERAETIAAKTETVKQIIETSNLAPEQKRIAFEVLDSIATDTRGLGRDVDRNKEIADKNQAAATRWHWFLWLAGLAGAAALAVGVRMAISRFWPG